MNEVIQYLGSLNPIEILNQWISEAQSQPDISEPTAFSLSTVNTQSIPSSRVLLAKKITERGIIFYTNEKSQKGENLKSNPQCAAHFYWDPLYRQINIQGEAKQISIKETLEYWKSRPRKKQIHQWISKQSQEVLSREFLNQKVREAQKHFEGKDIPCPEHWKGYHLIIHQIEFWKGDTNRLHDRFLFHSFDDRQWKVTRLYP